MSGDLPISELLADLGYRSDEARERALVVLVGAGLTNGRKPRIAATKVETVKTVLASQLVLVCARQSCAAVVASDPRSHVSAARPADCGVCGGSANESAIRIACRSLRDRGVHRVAVVGGSPATHEELRALIRGRLDLRLVSGTERRTLTDAKADLAWADVVVVWGSTQLDHKVSFLYTRSGAAHVVTCAKRGIAALADTLARFAASR